MKRIALVLIAVLAWQPLGAALAYHDTHQSHACPIPPPKGQYHFARGFKSPVDSETLTEEFQKSADEGGCGGTPWRVAGFGGRAFKPVPDGPKIPGSDCRGSKGTPVVFIHGNNVDAGDWYPALIAFKKQGYDMCQLWGLGYNGVGGNNGNALHTQNPRAVEERGEDGNTTRVTGNMINLPDVESFVRKVLSYTKARRFSVVSHSLGVTIVRRLLKDNADLLGRVDSFVGIAGANRGTTFCRGNEAFLVSDPESALISCDEIAPDVPGAYTNPWLADLNAGDETPGDARYLTVYDGSGSADPAFVGPDAPSPRLTGATNCAFSGAYHNDLRIDPVIATFYARFVAGRQLRQVEPGATPAAPEGSSCDTPANRP